jgi:hypothetical protein
VKLPKLYLAALITIGASVPVDDKHVPAFRASKLVHERLNQPD